MDMNDLPDGLSFPDAVVKRIFDIVFSFVGLLLLWWVILIAAAFAYLSTRENGFFTQERIGQFGKKFRIIKIRTMRSEPGIATNVTTSEDKRITSLGKLLRKTKIDELPQLINVFLGQMSFVGPRPDVSGFVDELKGDDLIITTVKPGITGPATLAYRKEEQLLATVEKPEEYNRQVIFPDKVRINKEYIRNYSLLKDLKYIVRTVFS